MSQNKHNNNKSDAVSMFLGLVTVLCASILAGTVITSWISEEDKKIDQGFRKDDELAMIRHGHTVTHPQRYAIDRIQDSTLVARTAHWDSAYADYKHQINRAIDSYRGSKDFFNRPNAGQHVVFPRGIQTLNEYQDFLMQYHRDSIETRYRHLARQLARQK